MADTPLLKDLVDRDSVGAIATAIGGATAGFDEDGFVTALDLAGLIDVLFSGATDIHDPLCPTTRGDLDCDGFSTALDLGGLIDHLFAGGGAPCDPCNP